MDEIEVTNKQALFIIWNAILNQSQDAKKTINNTLMLMERLGLINNFSAYYLHLWLTEAYLNKIKATYEEFIPNENYHIKTIDASGSLDESLATIINSIDKVLKENWNVREY